MKSFLLLAAAVGLLAGCATDNRTFRIADGTGRHGSSSETWSKDTYECKRDLMQSSIAFSRSVTAPAYGKQMLIECMQARGYSYE
jgi:hypothetical protein